MVVVLKLDSYLKFTRRLLLYVRGVACICFSYRIKMLNFNALAQQNKLLIKKKECKK